jgi:hypothetical protein
MKEMTMLKIVTTPAQAIANILAFESELAKSPALQDRLPYARAWYANKDADGHWHFGPSKFIGHQDVDAAIYLKEADEADGRRTEAQLQSFFSVVEAENPLHAELHSELVSFLAKYGKTPSTKVRINIEVGIRRKLREKADYAGDDDLVRLLVAVASKLPEAQLCDLRNQLEDVWA